MWHEDTFSQRNKTKKEQGRVGGVGQNLRKGGGGGGGVRKIGGFS